MGQGECATTSAAVSGTLSQTSVGEDRELLDGGEKACRMTKASSKCHVQRGKQGESHAVKSKKMTLKEKVQGRKSDTDDFSDTDSECDFSDLSSPDGQENNGYSLEQICSFLEETKGKRDVVVDELFPNQSFVIDSARWLMKQRGSDGLKDTEVYCL